MGKKVGSFFTTLKNMGASRLVAIAAVGLFLLGFLVYLTTSLNKTDMAVLFNELESADAKKIISKLEEENVDYRLTKNGTEVLVPIDKVLKMRVELAENVGSGAVVGYVFGVGKTYLNTRINGKISHTKKYSTDTSFILKTLKIISK